MRTLCCAALLLLPLMARADVVDVPEIGVKLTTMPEIATAPQVAPAPAGLAATTQVLTATLTIYRDSAPAAPGSDVAEPKYRASLDARFDYPFNSKSEGAPTDVGGHSGWTVVSTRPGASSGTTRYVCLTYVLVDQHLYRLMVSAEGATRPPAFDSLVSALSGIHFEPLTPAAHP
jgi:hypothetical protein